MAKHSPLALGFLCLIAVLSTSCERLSKAPAKSEPAKPAAQVPTGPIPGRHKITITRLALSDSDFSLTAFGNPREIELYAAKDGARKLVATIPGFRGPRDMNVSFELDYDPSSRYEFTIEEAVIMGQGKKWNFSGTMPGNWQFEKGGPFGAGSSIAFTDEKVR